MAESPNRRAGDIAALLERAAADRQAGRLADAEAACRAALALDPDHPVALNNLGAIRAQGGDPQAAVEISRGPTICDAAKGASGLRKSPCAPPRR